MVGRLVGAFSSIYEACVTYEEICTILGDCEAVINARPLTNISDDPTDLSPLTPSMFLQEIRESGVPELDVMERVDLKGRYLYRQKLKDDLRHRFRSEYLGLLHTKHVIRQMQNLKVSDLVWIGDDIHKRLDWPMGRVTDTISGSDNNIRVIKLKTENGQLLRPIQRLYPLEIFASQIKEDSVDNLNDLNINKINEIKFNSKKRVNNKDEIKEKHEIDKPYVTRSGRISKKVLENR